MRLEAEGQGRTQETHEKAGPGPGWDGCGRKVYGSGS